MRRLLIPLACLLLATAAVAGEGQLPDVPSEAAKPPANIAQELASGDGLTKETAIVIYSDNEMAGVAKEYAIMRFLGLKPTSQSLVTAGGTYDRLEATDRKTGEPREVWFDISKFFGKL